MTTLYRSPNIVVDQHEWHVTVETHCGRRPVRVFRFRPIDDKRAMWQLAMHWKGRRPKAMWKFFAPYKRSIEVAITSAGYVQRSRAA